VNTQGVALPATGYRYMDSQYFALTQDTMSAPLSYFGFRAYSGGATRVAFRFSMNMEIPPHGVTLD
jgi:hypothetical protein